MGSGKWEGSGGRVKLSIERCFVASASGAAYACFSLRKVEQGQEGAMQELDEGQSSGQTRDVKRDD
jgi:hypothetical protein